MLFHSLIRNWTASEIIGKIIGVYVFLIVFLGALSFAAESRTNWAVKAYEQNREAVVCIQGDKIDETGTSTSREAGKAYNGMGTGIVIDERGYIITNYHVVEGIRKIQVTTFDRTQYIAQLVARDTGTDLAVIKINARKPLKTITLGRSDDLMPGENCLAIGNPFGYDFSLTDGRISGIGREVEVNDTLVYRDAIQTNTEINPGNSGGPLLNVDGEMVGINAAIRQGASGIAFAIPVNQVVQIAGKLLGEIANQSVSHGIKVNQSDSEGWETIGTSPALPSGKRYVVVVQSVEENSPAAESGVKTGDIIRGIGKYSIGNVLDFSRALLDIEQNNDVSFTVVRKSETLEVAVSMGSPRDENSQWAKKDRSPMMKSSDITPKTASAFRAAPSLDERVWSVLGIRYAPMPKEEYQHKFAQFLSERPHGGVVVKQVREESQIAEVGVIPGDVIVGIHEWVTTSENDVRYIAKNWQNINTKDGTVKLLLFRDGTPYFTELPLK